MTAKQALIRCADMMAETWGQSVIDKDGYAHWVAIKDIRGIVSPVLGTDNPDYPPFATCLEPYRFVEDMT